MTVPAYTGPNTSVANGVTTTFPYGFKILSATDLMVTVNGVIRSLGTHYTVSGVGAEGGGNVEFLIPPAANSTVIRKRNMPFIRSTQYQNLGDLLASTLNDDQDAPVMMIQQLAASVMQLVLDPATGQFVWDAQGNRIIRVGDAVQVTDAVNLGLVLNLIEQIQTGGGGVGVDPKFWTFEGDGEVTDFPLPGADVFDALFYDTALEATAGAGDYLVSKPSSAADPGEYQILEGVDGAPPVIRFAVAPGDEVRGFTTLRGYARPWIGQPPIYTVAPKIVSITADTTLAVDMHNTLILANSATPITLTMRANTGGSSDWKDGQFFTVVQMGAGQVTLVAEGSGQVIAAAGFSAKTRAAGSPISASCISPDAGTWLASGDLLRTVETPDLLVIELQDRGALIGTDITATAGRDCYAMPFGMVLEAVLDGGCYASLSTAQASGTPLTVDLHRNGTSILSTKLTFDNAERTTATAAAPAVYAAGGNVLFAGDELTLDVDQVGTAGARGLRVYLVGRRA